MKLSLLLGMSTLTLFGLAPGLFAPPPDHDFEFDRALLILETNATDGDAEIVLDLKSGVDIVRLEVKGPMRDGEDDDGDDDGERKVLDLRSDKGLGVGLSQILLETGEPTLQAVLEAYPAGTYELSGRTLEGRKFRTTLELTHGLPGAPEILFPAAGDDDIPVVGLVITWAPNASVASWLVELEREDDGVGKIVATLPAGTSSFAVPQGFLVSGVEYQVGVRASNAEGNVNVSEFTFTTL